MHPLPPDIQSYVQTIRAAKEKETLTEAERAAVSVAKFKLACWVCQKEGLKPTRENLAAVLGPDAAIVLGESYRALISRRRARDLLQSEKEERDRLKATMDYQKKAKSKEKTSSSSKS